MLAKLGSPTKKHSKQYMFSNIKHVWYPPNWIESKSVLKLHLLKICRRTLTVDSFGLNLHLLKICRRTLTVDSFGLNLHLLKICRRTLTVDSFGLQIWPKVVLSISAFRHTSDTKITSSFFLFLRQCCRYLSQWRQEPAFTKCYFKHDLS